MVFCGEFVDSCWWVVMSMVGTVVVVVMLVVQVVVCYKVAWLLVVADGATI